jgi:hypothetical protein
LGSIQQRGSVYRSEVANSHPQREGPESIVIPPSRGFRFSLRRRPGDALQRHTPAAIRISDRTRQSARPPGIRTLHASSAEAVPEYNPWYRERRQESARDRLPE